MPSFSEGKAFTLEICMGSSKNISPEAQKIQKELGFLLNQGNPDHPAQEMSGDLCAFSAYVGQYAISDNRTYIDRNLLAQGHSNAKYNNHVILQNISYSFSARAPPYIV